MKKDKESMLASLSQNIPAEVVSTELSATLPTIDYQSKIDADTEEDYDFSRTRIKKLIDTSDEAISSMLALATDSEHPRAFEVLSNMFKTAADMNQQLMTLQRDRKKMHETIQKKNINQSACGTSTTNNAIFVGTTTELQKFLNAQKTIDVDNE
jgi:hypothetical protein